MLIGKNSICGKDQDGTGDIEMSAINHESDGIFCTGRWRRGKL